MSKLQDIQQILKEYADNIEQVDKKELLNVLTELCNYCIVLEKESITLLQNRNSNIECEFSEWVSLYCNLLPDLPRIL